MCKWLFFPVFLFWFAVGSTQENSFVFSHLTEDDGLPDNVVNCFLKDSRGIMWIGTYNGFSRFDGSNFYNYKKRKGANSMANEVVHRLCEDKKGNIWGATDNGVFCYIPLQDKFINYSITSFGIIDNSLNVICDSKGKIWVTGSGVIATYNEKLGKFEETIKLTNNKDSLRSYSIPKNGLRYDSVSNSLWITTRAGIMYYDIEKAALLNYKNSSSPLFRKRSVSALTASSNGNYWFFDNNEKEIVSFNSISRQEKKKINIRSVMPDAAGGTLFEDSHQRLWFSSWSYELLVVDQQHNNRASRLIHRTDDKRSVAGLFFWDVYEDVDKNIWLGTIGGISKCNPERILYRNYQLPAIIPELKNTSIVVAEENPVDNSIWIVTANSLLIRYNPFNQGYNVFNFNHAVPATGGVKPGYCYNVRFLNGNAILQTRTGVWQVKKGDKKITPFQYYPKGFENFNCIDIVVDADSVLYYSNGTQLLYWNHITGQSKLITYDNAVGKKKADANFISALTLTTNHQLWMVASATGVARLTSDKKLEQYEIIKDKTKEKGTILSIDQDKMGNVWVLNKGVGIYSLNPKTNAVKFWDETDGLAGNRMHRLVTDTAGRLWSMLYNKASVFIPGAIKFSNFKIPYSESNLNYYNHLTRLINGNIITSINNEIVEFYPKRLLNMPSTAAPQISQLIAGGKTVSLFDDKAIVLQPGDNTIRLHFGTLINKDIFPFDVEYKLEGAENDWTLAGDNHEALYNNLNPGTYQFFVRVRGKNSSWQTKEAVVKFTIKAPFYKTNWFIAVIALLVAGILYFFYRYRVYQKEKLMNLENKANALEKEKALVMYEGLKQQLNPHFLFNSLTSLNSLIHTDSKTASSFLDSLSKTYRYILKSRDSETVALGDELKFAENYVKLQQTRFEKGFEVNMRVPEEYHHHKIVPVTLQNLIENAIKHNIIDEDSPLIIDVYVSDDYLIVQNNLQKKNFVETSNKQGLSNLLSLYSYLSSRPFEIKEENNLFIVKIPLI
jgi:ligand-binding sensor domain-containing protein